MRIIAGKYKSRKIFSQSIGKRKFSPEKYTGYRPTTDKARESLFDMLSNRIDFDRKVCIDLFAGSGSLGFEALSRGAEFCTFVDISKTCCKNIEQTSTSLGCEEQVSIIRLDTLFFLKNNYDYTDIIFADPPYRYEFQFELLNLLMGKKVKTIVIESDFTLLPEYSEGYNILQRISGKTYFTILFLE